MEEDAEAKEQEQIEQKTETPEENAPPTENEEQLDHPQKSQLNEEQNTGGTQKIMKNNWRNTQKLRSKNKFHQKKRQLK